VAVEKGATLEIEPGVTVNLESYYIRVNGTFIAKGTVENKIYINGKEGSDACISFWRNSTSWNEQTGSGSIIQNAVVNCGLGFSASPKVDNNYIRGSISIQGSPVISNNDITSHILILGGEVNAQIIGNDIKGLIFGYHRGTVLVSNNVITGTYSDAWTGGGITCAG
jgi:hypothetical protein